MINMYTSAVKYGYMTIDQVPTQYRLQVEEAVNPQTPAQ